MRRMQIGMWNNFDPAFWQAYGSESIKGIEISQYKSQEDLSALLAYSQSKGLTFGIHAPIFSNRWYPKVISPVRFEREAGMEQIREEARLAAEFGADYLLYHYPFPPILSAECDSNFWPQPEFEHYESAKMDPDQLRVTSIRLFEQLCSIQKEYKQRIVLEYDFFGDFGDLFVEMFQSYPEVGLVVDVQ
jgi:sugar phosphate isomerase/epimerase